MKTQTEIADDLIAYGNDRRPALTVAEVALMIGALDRPALPLDRYRRHMDKLADKIKAYARIEDGPVPVAVMAEALNQIIARHYGYGGISEGADADCFDMSRVIDSREGASEALAILYADIARRVGWVADLIRVPGRMFVRLENLGERMIVDPIEAGRPVDPADMRAVAKAASGMDAELTPAMMEPLSDRSALLRLLGGHKSMLLRAHKLEEAKAVIDRSLMIAPTEPTLWRECGLMNARLDRLHDAVAALEEYLRLGAGDQARYDTSLLLQELRERLS